MAGTAQAGTELAQPGAGSSLANATALAGNARAWLTAMHPARRRQLGAAVLFTAAVVSALVWYANRPDWRMLYTGLESKDLQQVAQELTAANIPYQMTDDSSGIEVSSDQLDRARMEVATKGMPQTGRMGFELFDKPNWVGSEFDEKVTVPEASVREIVSGADKQVLARALRNASEDLRAHLFKAMSTRAVEMLKDDMESLGPLRAKEINAAQQEILALASSLEAEGRVTLRIEPEEELAD